jgi:hypothetical protein
MSTKERITLKNTNRLLDPFLFGLGVAILFYIRMESSKTFSSVDVYQKLSFLSACLCSQTGLPDFS